MTKDELNEIIKFLTEECARKILDLDDVFIPYDTYPQDITEEEYMEEVNRAIRFLKGETKEVAEILKEKRIIRNEENFINIYSFLRTHKFAYCCYYRDIQNILKHLIYLFHFQQNPLPCSNLRFEECNGSLLYSHSWPYSLQL